MEDSHETVKLLRGIWNEMKSLNGRIDKTNARLESGFADVNARLERGVAEVAARIDKTNSRLDHLVEFVGERWREHGRALHTLGRCVTRLESRSGR